MNEDAFDPELAALHDRWARESTPKLALQLAEEYGRRGLAERAVEVLETALRSLPGHLSARVALGRYRMDLGNTSGAVEALERVVKADPTHLVANKLLVKGYSELGEVRKARDRLDLYRLLNESDPEIAALQQQVTSSAEAKRLARGEARAALAAPSESGAAPSPDTPAEPGPPAGPEGPVGEELEEVFELELDQEPGVESAAAVPAVEDEAAEAASPEESEEDTEPDSGVLRDLPFPELWQLVDEATYRESLYAELFRGAGRRGRPREEPQGTEEPAPAAADQAPPAGDPEQAKEEEASSVTLAELYSGQGHRAEAIRTLRGVLSREPENRMAMSRLAALVAAEEGELTAFDLLDGMDFATAVSGEERRARLLRSYLDRLSGGARADV
jgi:tetratricopeptide (TPR) repeat protein